MQKVETGCSSEIFLPEMMMSGQTWLCHADSRSEDFQSADGSCTHEGKWFSHGERRPARDWEEYCQLMLEAPVLKSKIWV